MDWIWTAVAAMFFLAISNVALKLLADRASKQGLPFMEILPFAAVIVLAILASAAYLVLTGRVDFEAAKLAALFVACSTIAFWGIAIAMGQGKASVVTALMALSAIVVAAIGYFLTGERLTLKEMAGIALAIASVIVLAA